MENSIIRENALGSLQELLDYWFVKYNPFYFFSALCILSGVFLVSRELNQLNWTAGKLVLAATVQVYEFFLIFACALLFRKLGQHRAAVILGLLEVLFLFDCTCETELLMSLGQVGVLLTIIWASLIVVKITLLAWAFQLKLTQEFFIAPLLAAIGLVLIPVLLEKGFLDKQSTHLLATWALAGLIAIVVSKRSSVICNIELDNWGSLVLKRSITATWAIWLTICSMHLLSYLIIYNINLSIAHFTPFILLWLLVSQEEELIWVSSVVVILVSLNHLAMFAPTLLVISLVLLWKGKILNCPRLWVGALLVVYYALYRENQEFWLLPKFTFYLNLVTGCILLLMTYRLRLILAGLIGAMLVLWPISYYGKTMSLFHLGVLLLITGFLSLIVGVGFNWKQSTITRRE